MRAEQLSSSTHWTRTEYVHSSTILGEAEQQNCWNSSTMGFGERVSHYSRVDDVSDGAAVVS